MKRLNVNVPDELHKRLKIRCAEEGLEITEVVLRLLEEHLAKGDKKKSKQ
jgi:hypothetical protein